MSHLCTIVEEMAHSCTNCGQSLLIHRMHTGYHHPYSQVRDRPGDRAQRAHAGHRVRAVASFSRRRWVSHSLLIQPLVTGTKRPVVLDQTHQVQLELESDQSSSLAPLAATRSIIDWEIVASLLVEPNAVLVHGPR